MSQRSGGSREARRPAGVQTPFLAPRRFETEHAESGLVRPWTLAVLALVAALMVAACALQPELAPEQDLATLERLEGQLSDFKTRPTGIAWTEFEPWDSQRVDVLGRLERYRSRQDDASAKLVKRLEELRGDASVERLLAHQLSIRSEDNLVLWQEAIAAIEASPRYDRLEQAIEPQIGLVPLGEAADSGLWEFAHVLSGEVPEWSDGHVVPSPDMAVVLVLLPGGRFWMGAQKEGEQNVEPEAIERSEEPVHEVTVAPFFLSKYELTQGQWLRLAGRNPSHFSGQEDSLLRPVERVSWNHCQRLRDFSGLRLPSEAEWEYAGRAETQTPYSFEGGTAELHRYAWYADNSGEQSHPVGGLRPNDFGLHDMHGNIWEWCQDSWHDSYDGAPDDGSARETPTSPGQVCRGGAWRLPAETCRSAFRSGYSPNVRNNYLGMRPATSVER